MRCRTFGLDVSTRWNSTYLMLQKVIPYKAIFTTWLQSELGGQVVTDEDWDIAEAMHSFLKTFYLATVSLSAVYNPTSHLALHEILEISTCFAQHRDNTLLKPAIIDMEDKFKRYWTTIPYLYSFGFILDPRMRLTKFFDILTLIGEHMGIAYTETIYKDTETRFYAVFSSYEDEFYDEETQPPEVEVSHYESPVKRTYPMLAAYGTSQSSTSSHNRSSPGSQHTEVQKYLNSGWVEHAKVVEGAPSFIPDPIAFC